MKKQTILGIIAAIFIFFGFGMIHGTARTAMTGNVLIGVGCAYLIYRIYISMKNTK